MSITGLEQTDIKVTEKAVKQIKQIMDENNIPESHGIRIGVKKSGCSGLSYSLGFDADSNDGDKVINFDGMKLFVDGKSLFYLTGTELDFSDGLNGKGFVFNNPDVAKTCGCGN
ncbi:MAG: iron-sulfur cluster assembly accessory protein [Ignavibacteria bacterium]